MHIAVRRSNGLKAEIYPKGSGIRIREIINTSGGEAYDGSYLVVIPAKLTGTVVKRKQFKDRDLAEEWADHQFQGFRKQGEEYFKATDDERELPMKYRKLLCIIAMMMCIVGHAQSEEPNIILIMADDMGQECLGTYGAKDYKTPNLDRLAGEGVKFNNCFATPLCSPSRVSIMTGKYNYRNYEEFLHINPDEITFGNLFRDGGYHTAIAGKWQLGGDGNTINSLGFDEYCVNNIAKPKEVIWEANGRYAFPLMYQNGRFLEDDEVRNKYGPDIILDFVCDFIDKKEDKPFFVYYPMILVHSPFVPTPHSKDWLKTEEKDPKYFSDMVEYTDDIVGRLLKHLGERDLLDNTLVIFTADNGTHRSITTRMSTGEKIVGEKGMLTDAGLRVPLIASYGGKSPSRELNDLIDFSDILPTILQAATIESSEEFVTDGHSFYPQIIGRKGSPRKWAFCHYDPVTWFSDFNDHAGRVLMMDGYRMYNDGRMFSMVDRLNENQLPPSMDNEQRAAIRSEMEAIIAAFPDYDFDKNIERMKEIRDEIKADRI